MQDEKLVKNDVINDDKKVFAIAKCVFNKKKKAFY